MPQHHWLSSGVRVLHLRSDDTQKSQRYSSTLAWIAIGAALIFIAPPCNLLTMRSDNSWILQSALI
jgi:hypothetical protein